MKMETIGNEVQSVLFRHDIWTEKKALAWLKKHKLKNIKKVDKTLNCLRYRIKDPKLFSHFSTAVRTGGISFVIGFNSTEVKKMKKPRKPRKIKPGQRRHETRSIIRSRKRYRI